MLYLTFFQYKTLFLPSLNFLSSGKQDNNHRVLLSFKAEKEQIWRDFTKKAKFRIFPNLMLLVTSSKANISMSMVTPLFLCLCAQRISTDTSYVDGSCSQRTLINSFQHSAPKCSQILAWCVEKSREHCNRQNRSKHQPTSIFLFQEKMKTLIYLGRD